MEQALTPPPCVSTFSIACLRVDHRAAVLGATLAFGTCTLTACGEDVDHTPEIATVSSTAPVEHEEVVPHIEEPPSLDFDAEEGRVGTFEASPGFTPDPLTHPGTTAPGVLDAQVEDEHCHGWLAPEPDYVFTATRSFAELALMVASREDTTLFVVDPDGRTRCGDDEEGRDPLIRAQFEPGVYRVWVGTRERDTEAPYVLALSELDETSPAELSH